MEPTTFRARRRWLGRGWLALWAAVVAGRANPVWAQAAPAPASAPSGRSITLPLQQAWFEGERVDYVSTDTSDAAMAQAKGINHVPLLRHAIKPLAPGQSLVERVYMFAGNEQLNVFPSVPRPLGPANADRSYSPLWRGVWVRWKRPADVRELRSEEAVLEAEDKGLLTLEMTDIVINCPVLRDARGAALRGVV